MKLKWKLNKLKKYYQYLFENNKTHLSKTWAAIRSTVKVGRKSKRRSCSLKHNCLLLLNRVKIAETLNFFGKKITYHISKWQNFKVFLFYPTTLDKIIKIVKYFSNNVSVVPNSLPASILKKCADVLSFSISYLVNPSFTTGEFPN